MSVKSSKIKHKFFLLLLVVLVAFIVFLLFGRQKNGIYVVVAKSDISVDTLIDKSNVDSMFETRCVNEDMVPEKYVKDTSYMIGKRMLVGIGNNTVIQKSFAINKDNDVERMKEPVIMGLKVSDMSQMVCGTIRENDIIDISVINMQTDECIDVLRNVRVKGCYNSDGSLIADDGCAMYINVTVEKSDEQYVNQMLSLGELRICKAGGHSE